MRLRRGQTVRLVAQIETAILRKACLQFSSPIPPPDMEASRLGHAGLVAPMAAAAARARMVGRYSDSAVHER